MMILLISASPNSDGLTAACVQAARQGISDAGAESRHLDLCAMRLEHCRQCGNGWGSCREEHHCVIDDQLDELMRAVGEAEAVVWVTPVYFGDLSEAAKAAFDRLRRCNFWANEAGLLRDTPVICIAAAGGSGGGITTCLLAMERYIQHMRGQVADLIGITRRNRLSTLSAIRAAAATLVPPTA